jgi:hypothetical protein
MSEIDFNDLPKPILEMIEKALKNPSANLQQEFAILALSKEVEKGIQSLIEVKEQYVDQVVTIVATKLAHGINYHTQDRKPLFINTPQRLIKLANEIQKRLDDPEPCYCDNGKKNTPPPPPPHPMKINLMISLGTL